MSALIPAARIDSDCQHRGRCCEVQISLHAVCAPLFVSALTLRGETPEGPSTNDEGEREERTKPKHGPTIPRFLHNVAR